MIKYSRSLARRTGLIDPSPHAMEQHRRELHAVRVAAADTSAAHARLQAAHRDLRQEYHDLRTSAALYRDMLAADSAESGVLRCDESGVRCGWDGMS